MTRKSMFQATVYLLSLLVIGGCASRGEIESFQSDFSLVKEQLTRIEDRQTQQDSLYDERMDLMRLRLLEGEVVLRQVKAEQLSGQEELAALIHEVRASMDDADVYNQRLARKVDELNLLLARQGLQQERDSLAVADPQWLYNQATLDRYRGFPDLARAGYKEYLARFSDGTMAAAASYWLAETWMAQQEVDSALFQLNRFQSAFPESDFISDARLKTALMVASQGKIAEARVIYEALILDFPESSAARLAAERLEE